MEAKEIETGGQAFPVEDVGIHGSYGMTLRDFFAAKAMQGMLAYPGCDQHGSHHNNNTAAGVAAMAYDYADAMLSMRAQ